MSHCLQPWLPRLPLLAATLLAAGCATRMPPAAVAVARDASTAPVLPEGPVSLPVAVAHALATAPELRAADGRLTVAAWEEAQAALSPNPVLTLSIDPTEWAAGLMAPLGDRLDLGRQRSARIRSARQDREAAAAEAMGRRIALARAVRHAFADVVTWRAVEALHVEKRKALADRLELTRIRVALGEGAANDTLALRVVALEAAQAEAEALAQRRSAEATLNRHLGRALDDVTPLEGAGRLGPPWDLRAHDTLDLGAPQRPELALLLLRIEAQGAALAAARYAWVPAVEAGAYVAGGDDPSRVGGEVSLTLPVLDTGRVRRQREEARHAALRAELDALQAALLLEAHHAILALRQAEQRAERDAPALVAATAEAARAAEAQAQAGEADVDAVLQARSRWIDSRIAAAVASGAWWRAQADLAAAVGDTGGTGDGAPRGGEAASRPQGREGR